jgi:hypothetical protein
MVTRDTLALALVADSCEHDNKPVGFIKGMEWLE